MSTLQLAFSHSQISVFRAGIDNPFNDWEKDHVTQGFSWRPQSVSFRTLDEGGVLEVEVSARKRWTKSPGVVRAIKVPFIVTESGVEVATIVSGQLFDIPAGAYCLYFETGRQDSRLWCRLTFVPDEKPSAAVIVADKDLSPSRELLMTASPALP